jgi:type IV pilus assembly protein PilB
MATTAVQKKLQLGQVLQDRGVITEEQILQALEEQQKTGHSKLLGEVFVELGFSTENQVASALAEAYGVPYVQLSPKICDPAVVEVLPREFLDEHVILPLFKVHDVLTVAVSEPSNVFLIDEIEHFIIDDIIEDTSLEDFSLIETVAADISDLEEVAGQSPVVKLVNYLLYNAVIENASDIHIEPGDKRLRIRYRVDGRLYEKMSPPYQMHAAIVSRVKIMAELDIAQRRLPQDGGIHVLMEGRAIDLRVSIMPGIYGEKVVIRVIDARKMLTSLESLGFSYDNLQIFQEKLAAPNGIVLVTGPTGSGKNTTLYAGLASIASDEINICTVEDPVECNVTGLNQFPVSEAAGFGFSTALRSLLRQDPDVVMVGEIRDNETASIAVQAALTGHLVLSTLHTNDAPGAVTRLVDLGVAPYLVSASLIGVLAQRLVRKICPNCKEEQNLSAHLKKVFDQWIDKDDKFFRGIGCKKCRNTGYLGRIALHEFFLPNGEILDSITQGATLKELRREAVENGMKPLHIDGFEKAKAGITTLDEVLRVSNIVC